MKSSVCLLSLGRYRIFLFLLSLLFCPSVFAQGGPPYYTNDPGTPGNLQWEINLGYMPFLFPNSSISHTPDVDINFGIGDRIQLTYESAWLRVADPSPAKFGLGQDQLGFKWRFLDNKDFHEVRVRQEQAVSDLEESVRLSIARYQGGTTTYLEVLDGQRSLFAAELTLAEARGNEYQCLVQLYRALGGGWQT